jgi:hypothetical protein
MRKQKQLIRHDALIKNAIRYAVLTIGRYKSGLKIRHNTITKIFGRRETRIGKVLRKLIAINGRYIVGQHCQSYIFNPDGLEEVCHILGISESDLASILDIKSNSFAEIST